MRQNHSKIEMQISDEGGLFKMKGQLRSASAAWRYDAVDFDISADVPERVYNLRAINNSWNPFSCFGGGGNHRL